MQQLTNGRLLGLATAVLVLPLLLAAVLLNRRAPADGVLFGLFAAQNLLLTAILIFSGAAAFAAGRRLGRATPGRASAEPVAELSDQARLRTKPATSGSARDDSAGRESVDVLVQAFRERYPTSEVPDHDVAEMAGALADRLGIAGDESIHIRQAGELHDIGKIAIPDAILEKPGALEPGEWEYVRQHPIVGARIIGAAPALKEVAAIVRSTHERWDGSGYPDALSGEDIPLGSRIIAICDAFNAMMGARSYREGIGEEMAVEQLRRCAGTQFDPELVRIFFAVHAELRGRELAELAV